MEPSPRVAVIHGQRRILAFLTLELMKAGLTVRSAENADGGFELVRDWEPNVIVVDAKIPGLDCIALLRLLRLYTQAPIVVLGIGLDPQKQAECLRNGADYCVTLPAEMQELVAVLYAALRRPALRDPEVRIVADLELNLRTRTASRQGRALTLTRQEFDLLAQLVREPDRVYSRRELLAAVWGDEFQTTERAVDACVSGLRQKIDAPFGVPILRTVRGVGFTVQRPIQAKDVRHP